MTKYKTGGVLLASAFLLILLLMGCSPAKPKTSQVNQPGFVAPSSTAKLPAETGPASVPGGRRPGAGADRSADVKELTAQELADMLAAGKNLVVIDVGTSGEYKEGHIKGSAWGDMRLLRTRPEEYLASLKAEKTDTIVLVCETGNKSYNTVPDLLKAGYQSVYNLKGGKLDWMRAGYDLTKD